MDYAPHATVKGSDYGKQFWRVPSLFEAFEETTLSTDKVNEGQLEEHLLFPAFLLKLSE